MAGIFITRGMTIAIPPGGLLLALGKDRKTNHSIRLHVRFDVCPTWVELSLRHLANADNARADREAAWMGRDENTKAAALEKEFEASMQAIMSAAIALDAFYAILQEHAAIPQTLVEAWRSARTARYAQVTEVVRRTFRLKPEGVAVLRKNLSTEA